MRTPYENIRQLLEMLDNPDAYTEQEIRDIINRDDDTRKAYRLMVDVKRSSRHRHNDRQADTDAAWQRFCAATRPTAQRHASFFALHASLQKAAAAFVGVLLVSGIAFAAIHMVRHHQEAEAPMTEVTESPTGPATTVPADTLAHDSVAVEPVTYDNVPLGEMLPEVAAHYEVKVTFARDEVRGLRFRFVWNPRLGIDQVVSDLNQFERLTVTLSHNQITVE